MELKFGNQYIIQFKGLKEGKHPFSFDITKPFFEEYQVLEVVDGRISVEVVLNKKSQHMELDIRIDGFVNVQCDRCLDYFDLPIDYEEKIYVKFSDQPLNNIDNIIELHPNEYELNLKQYLFESIGLSIPYKKVHPENKNGKAGCNKEMISKLEALRSSGEQHNDDIDPRWDKLKNIIVNKN